ncbi:putative DNA binding protein [Enterococcus sp. PF1-24]|uniref:hypothetical protein n=1 Tax=unclassified Enterococcus TaxID=2608891 RepID=UPI0024747E28|nr:MULTISPECIES: hypothetical protein [unclassified Enterococcus]MDH6365662.1 putative DNA binding protein [Enterococcus sp. PFB1-1]MDH6402755.1 putative DNA binding protein [Enterococcus sp. PF1-24]
MTKENYTIREVAEILNISKQAVQQKLTKDFRKNYVTKKGNRLFISNAGLIMLRAQSTSNRQGLAENNKELVENRQAIDKYIEYESNGIDHRTVEFKTINDDSTTDKQSTSSSDNFLVDSEKEFLRDLVHKLQEEKSDLYKLLDQQQQLQLKTQNELEQLRNQQSIETSVEPSEVKKQPFWKRLFQKK